MTTIKIGNAIKAIRHKLELSQRAAATALGISFVHLCNVENSRAEPSLDLLDKFQETWGIDPYVYAWALDNRSKPFRATGLAASIELRIGMIGRRLKCIKKFFLTEDTND